MNLKTAIRFLKTSPLMLPVLAAINGVLWSIDRLAIWTSRPNQKGANKLLIIKLDLLGDYLMFRQYLRYLKQHPTYQHYEITVVGNVAFRQLAQHVDADIVSQFIWVDIYKLTTNPLYRFQTVRKIRTTAYAITFCPTYSRVLVLDDFLASASGAPVRVGCVPDLTNAKPWEVWIGNQCYTRLLPTNPRIVFEAERNRDIFSEFLGEDVPLLAGNLSVQPVNTLDLPESYIIISPGAGAPDKIWPMARFAAVMVDLNRKHPPYTFVVTGTAAEQALVDELRQHLPIGFAFINKVGQISQAELVVVVANARLVIANDSGIVHIAAALQVCCISLSAGKSLVRWHPYPAGISSCIHHVYPAYFDQWQGRFDELAPLTLGEAPVSIQTLDVDRVKRAVDSIISADYFLSSLQ